MNHLSEQELFDYVDRRLSAAAELDADAHCAACAHCRQIADLHRALAKGAAAPVTGLLPRDFAESVMRRAHVPKHASRFSWLLQNSSNIVAMIVVLGILASVIYVASQSQPSAGTAESTYLQTLSLWKDASSSALTGAISGLMKHVTKTVKPIVSESGKVFGGVFWLGAAAFLVLALADKLRTRMKMMIML